MRGIVAQAAGLLLLLSSALVGTVVAGIGTPPESSLVLGVLAVLLCAWGVVRCAAVTLPTASGSGPAVAAREHHRVLARRAVPRQRDPDAAGHTRSRAPSGLLPVA